MDQLIRIQRPFFYRGRVPISKSWLARALILRSLHPQVRILDWEAGSSDGEDVIHLDVALKRFSNGETSFHIGESGTGLRFLMARLSVKPGTYTITASERLMSRPHNELIRILNILGVEIQKNNPTELKLVCTGWQTVKLPSEIVVDGSESSQFRSALLLAASHISDAKKRPNFIGRNEVSQGYIELTQDLVDQVLRLDRSVLVPEFDASSIATLAAIAKAAQPHGDSAFDPDFANREMNWLRDQIRGTKQPDRFFFQLHEQEEVDLSDSPDLFPILAALGACGIGPRKLKGAPHLRFKETDRIAEIEKLFDLVGIKFQSMTDGILVHQVSDEQREIWKSRRRAGFSFEFAPPNDHRLAFAAAVLAAQGAPIQFDGRGMVAKSFPMFWSIVEGDAPKVAIIGHRGTGKSDLARRWAHWLGAKATAIDLDREIERLVGRSTRELFESEGESEFRFYEKKAFREVDEESRSRIGAFILSCGAGFNVHLLDESWKKIWIRRKTDSDGRIFFDRPRLEPLLHPREESLRRYSIRNKSFSEVSDREYWLAEGKTDPAEQIWARDLFDDDSIFSIGGTVTLMPNVNLVEALQRYLRWGVARIEIRDDLFPHSTFSELWKYLLDLPSQRLLISLRSPTEQAATLEYISRQLKRREMNSLMVDVSFDDIPMTVRALSAHAMEILKDPRLIVVASRHKPLAESDFQTWINLEDEMVSSLGVGQHRFVMKLALVTHDFTQLKAAHHWMEQQRKTRTFLPMSPATERQPRWSWYRLFLGSQVPHGLNFWKDGGGPNADQPDFSSWWRRERFKSQERRYADAKPFAAVLGDPVHHSRTPLEHDSFFTTKELPVFAIPVRREEAEIAIPFLQSLGLVAAAITSPLKEVSGQYFGCEEPVNSVVKARSAWKATSTDEYGFEALWKEAEFIIESARLQREIVVWGGGGVKPAMTRILQDATALNGRFKFLRASQPEDLNWNPDIVIWASGAQRGNWPQKFRPRLIVDLSYTDDSEARAIAQECNSRYLSGLTMFRVQAEKQREFWESHL
jgi:5-enolpyruvylshikimate-3-phosphate synthase/shikimate kinase/shikimate 5-dehydrogenase